MSDAPVPASSLQARRERTIAVLCEGYATDALPLGEFEDRLDRAHRATRLDELEALVSDLPAVREDSTPEPASRSARAMDRLTEEVRDSRMLLAFMGGVERRGAWQPARRTFVIGVMGGAELDFREVDLPPGVTEVQIFCCMGGAAIIVPPDLAVDSSGIAIMGGFEHAPAPRRPAPDAPVLRVNGFCLMGGVEIQVRELGESAKDARLRRREEKRLARDRARQRREQ